MSKEKQSYILEDVVLSEDTVYHYSIFVSGSDEHQRHGITETAVSNSGTTTRYLVSTNDGVFECDREQFSKELTTHSKRSRLILNSNRCYVSGSRVIKLHTTSGSIVGGESGTNNFSPYDTDSLYYNSAINGHPLLLRDYVATMVKQGKTIDTKMLENLVEYQNALPRGSEYGEYTWSNDPF